MKYRSVDVIYINEMEEEGLKSEEVFRLIPEIQKKG